MAGAPPAGAGVAAEAGGSAAWPGHGSPSLGGLELYSYSMVLYNSMILVIIILFVIVIFVIIIIIIIICIINYHILISIHYHVEGVKIEVPYFIRWKQLQTIKPL